MPRKNKKKGNEEDDFVVQSKQRESLVQPNQEEQDSDQLIFKNFVKQLLKEYSYLIKKRSKLTCSLCSINIPFSSFSAFKTEVSTHMKSKCHKKKIDAYNAEKGSTEKSEVDGKTKEQNEEKNVEQNFAETQHHSEQHGGPCKDDKTRESHEEQNGDRDFNKNNNKTLSDMIRDVEYQRTCESDFPDKKNVEFHSKNCLTDFGTTYCLLEKDNPVTQSSKKFIVKTKDGKNYTCKICQEMIFDSTNANEFKYNLWTHINDEKHRERLPNFPKVVKDFERNMCNLHKKLPVHVRDHLKYFEIGPVFKFFRCSLCNVAVSENLHRMQNHIERYDHMKNKENRLIIHSVRSINNHTTNWFIRLMTDMEDSFKGDDFKEDLKTIHIGKMPGYVVCSLCSFVVLPTFYYIKEHFLSDLHIKNKTAALINWESMFKRDQMKALQYNPERYSKFKESKYGIHCQKCNMTFPATSYELYRHMYKSTCK